jgi:hypothetical protein
VWRTRDAGESWHDCALPDADVFSLAVSAADGAVYAGTEPSRLFRSDDGGGSWRALDALLELPSRPTWSFPPRPWTSHVRWIAPSPHDGELLLAGIELGGLMRSQDGGRSWQDHRPHAQPDVHSLAWHTRAQGRAYEAGGGGAAFSRDAGESWQRADDGMDRHYTWSVAVDPEDPDRWFVSASTGPMRAHGDGDPQAGIFRRDGDHPWQRLAGGLPDQYRRCPMRWWLATAVYSPDSETATSGGAATAETPGRSAGSSTATCPSSPRWRAHRRVPGLVGGRGADSRMGERDHAVDEGE